MILDQFHPEQLFKLERRVYVVDVLDKCLEELISGLKEATKRKIDIKIDGGPVKYDPNAFLLVKDDFFDYEKDQEYVDYCGNIEITADCVSVLGRIIGKGLITLQPRTIGTIFIPNTGKPGVIIKNLDWLTIEPSFIYRTLDKYGLRLDY